MTTTVQNTDVRTEKLVSGTDKEIAIQFHYIDRTVRR